MRVRTDAKRREIIEAAAALFVEQGYDRASMSAISERLGGSKATLYGYFPSKEQLLRAVLEYDVAQETGEIIEVFPDGENLRDGMIRLGVTYLTHRLSDLSISNIRIVANQPAGSTIGRDFYANALRPAWQLLADHFETLMDKGRLRRADPWTATMLWKGLSEGELLEKRLLGASHGPEPDEIERAATLAADAFLRIYGAPEAAKPAPAGTPANQSDFPLAVMQINRFPR